MHTTLSPQLARTSAFKLPLWISALFINRQVDAGGAEQRVTDIHALQHLARDVELSQPNLAAELRHLAARN